VYGPAHDENKEQFLSELSNICAPKKFTSPGGVTSISSDTVMRKIKINWIINSYELREIFMNGGNIHGAITRWTRL
jgi:hypothetical protein